MNAAVWLGAAVLFTFGIEPGCYSPEMRATLGATGETYYSGAVAGVLTTRYYYITLACAVVALLHFLTEWLYVGQPRRKFSLWLIVGLFVVTLLGARAIHPAMTRLNKKHYTSAQAADRQSAAKYYRILSTLLCGFNVLTVGGLVLYAWRVGSPSDTLRFVRPVQFRS